MTAQEIIDELEVACWDRHGTTQTCRECLIEALHEALSAAGPIEPPAEPYRVVANPGFDTLSAVQRHDGEMVVFNYVPSPNEQFPMSGQFAAKMSEAFLAGFKYARKVWTT